MNLHVKYNIEKACRIILQEQLDKFNYPYIITDVGSIQFLREVSLPDYVELYEILVKYGIEIIDDKKQLLAQKVKFAIATMLDNPEMPHIKLSVYLADQLNESYRTIAKTFSEVCFMSVEGYLILARIEKVKQLLLDEELSLTEISFRLKYSSVAHLSNQFKKNTGFTPSEFQKIALQRKQLNTIIG